MLLCVIYTGQSSIYPSSSPGRFFQSRWDKLPYFWHSESPINQPSSAYCTAVVGDELLKRASVRQWSQIRCRPCSKSGKSKKLSPDQRRKNRRIQPSRSWQSWNKKILHRWHPCLSRHWKTSLFLSAEFGRLRSSHMWNSARLWPIWLWPSSKRAHSRTCGSWSRKCCPVSWLSSVTNSTSQTSEQGAEFSKPCIRSKLGLHSLHLYLLNLKKKSSRCTGGRRRAASLQECRIQLLFSNIS